MARYTYLFTITDSFDNFRHSLTQILKSCDFDVIYDAGDYVMAREVAGDVSFSKLVIAEVLVNTSSDTSGLANPTTFLSLIVKNEELPLYLDNHCQQKFTLLQQKIKEEECVANNA